MGGTGKTPCVLRVTELLKSRGQRPAILTRGYKRTSPHKHLALAPGASVSAVQTGDEPQIFIRSGLAPVGIGADRYRTAMLLRSQFDVDVMVLDDAFQHVRVARDVDIVLVDALNPFGGGELFPLGRLRETLPALSRASVVLITRAELSDLTPAIEESVRLWNADAPIFRARVEAQAWVEHGTGQRYEIGRQPFGRFAAFCALGNPQSFQRTLQHLGIEPINWMEFEDHHRYRPHELRRIAAHARLAGASALVTTEKDAINLCEGSDHLLAPLPLYWLQVGMRIEREDEFLNEIAIRIG
jgi:tetraacyldisaccharide 4'-kinase